MRGMDSGTVDLIATDPPFNKGVKAFKAKDGTSADGQILHGQVGLAGLA